MAIIHQVYLQPVENPHSILLAQTWNLERWLTPHRVGVIQTSGHIPETHKGRIGIIQPGNKRTRTINLYEVIKKLITVI